MKKRMIQNGILCAIPLFALALALYCLETYYKVVHNESSLLVCAFSLIGFIASTLIWRLARKNGRSATVLWAVSTLILLFVFYVGCKIPFCVECDRVTAEDLGFLTYWIQPIDGSP